MRPGSGPILALFIAASLLGPLLLGLIGAWRGRLPGAAPDTRKGGWSWRLVATSTLLYAFAFSLVFMVQEVFLVWPKALTPGLHPVLFHNNHTWTGDNPLARLFQGTGALAILLLGLAALVWSARTTSRSATLRLLGLWIACQGLYQSLPQLVAGAILPGNDVGMAMDYLHLGAVARTCGALLAMLALPLAGRALAAGMLALALPEEVATPRRAAAFVFQAATAPALLALPLIVLFRVPGGWDQVYLVPVVVSLLAAFWIQASAWRRGSVQAVRPARGRPSPWAPLAAVLFLLALFQLVLRRGVAV